MPKKRQRKRRDEEEEIPPIPINRLESIKQDLEELKKEEVTEEKVAEQEVKEEVKVEERPYEEQPPIEELPKEEKEEVTEIAGVQKVEEPKEIVLTEKVETYDEVETEIEPVGIIEKTSLPGDLKEVIKDVIDTIGTRKREVYIEKVTMRDIMRSKDPDEALTKIMSYVARDSRITYYSKEHKAFLIFLEYLNSNFKHTEFVKETIEEKIKSDPKLRRLYERIKQHYFV